MIGYAIGAYRRSPFHPHLGRLLALVLTRLVRLYRRGMFVHQVGAFRMNIDLKQRIDTNIYFTGGWEPDTVATIGKLVPAGGVALDVGANIGFIILVLAGCVGERGRVIGFEPTAWTYRRLRANVELNGLAQIETVHAGLSDAAELCEEADIPYGYWLDNTVATERQSIRMLTLDGYLAEHPVERLDFIKCDTDGMEEKVFVGGIETLRRFRPALHFELYQGVASDQVASSERLLRMLEGIGYDFVHEGSLVPFADVASVLRELRPGQRAVNVVAMPRPAGALGISAGVSREGKW